MENSGLKPDWQAEVRRQAVVESRLKPFKTGDAVGHPSDDRCWRFVKVTFGDVADDYGLVDIPAENSPTGTRIVDAFPLNEMFHIGILAVLTTLATAEKIIMDPKQKN